MAEFNQVFPPSTDIKVQQAQREQLILIHALRALPSSFEPIRAQLLGGSSLPTIPEAFSRVMRSTPQSHPSPGSAPPPSALVTQVSDRGAGRGRGRGVGRGSDLRPRCTYCHKVGHIRDTCYALHGRPPRANTSPTIGSTSSGSQYAFFFTAATYRYYIQR